MVITDLVPISFTVGSVASAGALITDTGALPAYVWQVQDLAPGDEGVITITGVLSDSLLEGDVFTNTATIAGVGADDADETDNSGSVAVTVHNEAPVAVVDGLRERGE